MGEAVKVQLLDADAYYHFWPQIEAELDTIPHIWSRWFTKDYLRSIPDHQELMVWGCGRGDMMNVILFGRVLNVPTGRDLQFILAFGNGLNDILSELEATFERLAFAFDCNSCSILGREGWKRKLPDFHVDYVVMSRNLNYLKVQ